MNQRGILIVVSGFSGAGKGTLMKELMKIFCSFISDAISNFNSDLYYQNPDYLEWFYREGKLLE